jgi:chorismate synthase
MNQFGTAYRISIFGESHGKGLGIVVDGCPAGIPLTESDFIPDLTRRRSGTLGTTPRKEVDEAVIMSGVYNHFTTGAPIALFFENNDARSTDYSGVMTTPRPGHADFVANSKWNGFNDPRGGGHYSGRLTLGLVAAGVIAKKIVSPICITSTLIEVGGSSDISAEIQKAIDRQDSIGGIVECIATNMPVGIGEPFFNSVESEISHLAFSIPAIKGIEFGAGFGAAKMSGSQHNDSYINIEGTTKTNHSGGINGGISNGNNLVFRVAIKPTSSTPAVQETLNFETQTIEPLKVEGRHDLCIALRIPPILEAITAIAIADLILQKNIVNGIKF